MIDVLVKYDKHGRLDSWTNAGVCCLQYLEHGITSRGNNK